MINLDERSADLDVPTWIVLGSFPVARPDGLHALVRTARAGDALAMAAILEHIRRAAPSAWAEITAGVAVPVPGHLPGPPDRLVVTTAREVAAVRGWRHDDALRRLRAAPEAKAGGPRDHGADAATLEWRPPSSGHAIVLVDDVVRSGATLRSCLEAIRSAGDERAVVAIALAAAIGLASNSERRLPLQPDLQGRWRAQRPSLHERP